MYYCYNYDFFGCAWVVIGQKQLRSYDAFLANRLGCIIYFDALSRENVGSKPWYRCGCTDDTPCRLGDAGSMTFLPWQQHRVLQQHVLLLVLLLLRALHQHEEVVAHRKPSDRVVGGAGLIV